MRRSEWAALKVTKPLKPFGETTFGFFGLGQIGRAVLMRLKGFRFHFIAADPMLTEAAATAHGVEQVTLDTLLARADIISLHAPATPETTGCFDAE